MERLYGCRTETGKVLWKAKTGVDPTMGLTFSNGIIYSAQTLGNPKTGYNIPAYPIVWKVYVTVDSAGGGDVQRMVLER